MRSIQNIANSSLVMLGQNFKNWPEWIAKLQIEQHRGFLDRFRLRLRVRISWGNNKIINILTHLRIYSL